MKSTWELFWSQDTPANDVIAHHLPPHSRDALSQTSQVTSKDRTHSLRSKVWSPSRRLKSRTRSAQRELGNGQKLMLADAAERRTKKFIKSAYRDNKIDELIVNSTLELRKGMCGLDDAHSTSCALRVLLWMLEHGSYVFFDEPLAKYVPFRTKHFKAFAANAAKSVIPEEKWRGWEPVQYNEFVAKQLYHGGLRLLLEEINVHLVNRDTFADALKERRRSSLTLEFNRLIKENPSIAARMTEKLGETFINLIFQNLHLTKGPEVLEFFGLEKIQTLLPIETRNDMFHNYAYEIDRDRWSRNVDKAELKRRYAELLGLRRE
ncbi:hypothetical protein M427DRAFT_150304 [Gonapodya prolifera JEL478]|uniref:Uncharacterized protein n=1 Tax=Gonapodya prolifera (strain JEL478) TaxID=1344416 RepID=A0A138ZWU5_GONPJ|nr:hypothetical protein M427DRAFT_150304 [Gonapodya prolifera JEL478]|eukprot:KXS08967.1 hypothetical protein M427DRAFT_150304 [Gonapodya prolifera JEL478]